MESIFVSITVNVYNQIPFLHVSSLIYLFIQWLYGFIADAPGAQMFFYHIKENLQGICIYREIPLC